MKTRISVVVALVLLLVMSASRPARADEIGAAFVGFGLVVGMIGSDVVFTAHDIGTAGRNEEPSRRWLVAETIITAPQALLAQGLLGVALGPDEDVGAAAFVVPATWITSLATHGAWGIGAAGGGVNPGSRYGMSWLLAADLSLTSAAVGRTVSGRLPGPVLAITELALTAPQVALGATQLAAGHPDRAGWAVLTAWSGALMAHGAVSLVVGGTRQRTKHESAARQRLRLTPAVLGDARAPAPGLLLAGTF